MIAPRQTVVLAAAAAVVPPAVLLGSTHSVALLIKTRRIGVTYWCALTMTVTLAGCAFVLSFDALRDLAVGLGFHADRAWLWPVAIDVSIAQSTLALLTLAPATHQLREQVAADRAAEPRDAGQSTERPRLHAVLASPTAVTAPLDAALAGQKDGHPLAVAPDMAADGGFVSADPAAVARWKPTALQLVRDGVTSKDPDVVAAILAEHAAGTSPSTIGRRQNVHHTTVSRILSAARGVVV
jgi:hypothetical protein